MNLLLVESILLPPPQQNAHSPILGVINLLATPIDYASSKLGSDKPNLPTLNERWVPRCTLDGHGWAWLVQ